jgi:Rod binding domain-containing protein
MTISAVNNLGYLAGCKVSDLQPLQQAHNSTNINGQAGGKTPDTLKTLANQVVNEVFYGTLMREFRNAQNPTLFDQGPGATTFIRQLDSELISRISQRGESPLAKALIRQLGGQAAIAATKENGMCL